jgi:hypothetical protein
MTTSGFNYMKARHLVDCLLKFSPTRNLPLRLLEGEISWTSVSSSIMSLVRIQSSRRPACKAVEPRTYHQAEWRTGRPSSEIGLWDDLLRRWRYQIGVERVGYLCDGEIFELICGLGFEIQDCFGFKLQKAEDGAPWIALTDSQGDKRVRRRCNSSTSYG